MASCSPVGAQTMTATTLCTKPQTITTTIQMQRATKQWYRLESVKQRQLLYGTSRLPHWLWPVLGTIQQLSLFNTFQSVPLLLLQLFYGSLLFVQDNPGEPVPEETFTHKKAKTKTNLDLLEQETVSGSGISWAICKSAPRPRQITMPAPHQSSFTGRSVPGRQVIYRMHAVLCCEFTNMSSIYLWLKFYIYTEYFINTSSIYLSDCNEMLWDN